VNNLRLAARWDALRRSFWFLPAIAMPLGALLGGVLAQAFGLRAPFVIGGIVPIVLGFALIPWINNHQVAEARRLAGE